MRATIVLLPGSDVGKDLRGLAVQWTREELLSPAWWAAATSPSYADENLTAEYMDRDGARSVSLFESLATQRDLELVRLVVVQMLPNARAADLKLARLARSVDAELRRRVPVSVKRVRINLLVPANDVTDIDREVLQPGWSVNAIASPEDRATGHRVSVGVGAENLVGHAAVETATIAGLWMGLEDGPFDDDNKESSDGEPDPLVVRSFARIVRGDEVIRHIADEVLDNRDGQWPLPSTGGPSSPVAAPSPAVITNRSLQELAASDAGMFTFQPADQLPPIAQRSVGVGQAILMMFRFLGRLLRRLPAYAVEVVENRVRTAIEERTTRMAFGQDSAFLVRVGGSGEEEPEQVDPRTLPLHRAVEEANKLLVSEDAPVYVGPSPETWQAIRSYCLGMIDGSDIPPPLTTPTAGSHRVVITDARALVPTASPAFRIGTKAAGLTPSVAQYRDLEIGPCDPYAAERLRLALHSAAQELRQKEAAAADVAARRRAEADVAGQRASSAPESEQAALWASAAQLVETADQADKTVARWAAKAQVAED